MTLFFLSDLLLLASVARRIGSLADSFCRKHPWCRQVALNSAFYVKATYRAPIYQKTGIAAFKPTWDIIFLTIYIESCSAGGIAFGGTNENCPNILRLGQSARENIQHGFCLRKPIQSGCLARLQRPNAKARTRNLFKSKLGESVAFSIERDKFLFAMVLVRDQSR
jgi:hypothetical protein